MRKALFFLLAISAIQFCAYGQSMTYTGVDNKDLVYALNRIEQMTNSVFNETGGERLHIRVYKVTNPSGSAGFPGGHEVSTSIYIAVSEGGEYPHQNLFRLTSVYNPKFIEWTKDQSRPILKLTYGTDGALQTAAIAISLRELQITTQKVN
jgi:hypothetical protein